MLPINNNYRTKYNYIICRGCKAEKETQPHVLQECKEIPKSSNTKVEEEKFVSEDVEVLTKAAKNIQFILNRIEQSDVPTDPSSLSVQPGTWANTQLKKPEQNILLCQMKSIVFISCFYVYIVFICLYGVYIKKILIGLHNCITNT